MISVVMPYWNRPQLMEERFRQFEEFYTDLDLVIVNDGSSEQPDWPDWVRVIHLNPKSEPKNPCVPINIGVGAALHSTIVLTNPECRHREPIFDKMRLSLNKPNDYVICAAYSPKQKKWHVKSGYKAPGAYPIPKGSGLHFCVMFDRWLWNRAGGFDKEYRDGQGFDDNDWLFRLEEAGANFIIRDDLVVDHVPTGVQWPKGAWARNKAIFRSKWRRRFT